MKCEDYLSISFIFTAVSISLVIRVLIMYVDAWLRKR
jgi:hypothetical protein